MSDPHSGSTAVAGAAAGSEEPSSAATSVIDPDADGGATSLGGSRSRLERIRARAQARERARAAAREAHAHIRAGGVRRRRTPEELKNVVERGQALLHGTSLPGGPDTQREASAEAVIAWAVREFGPWLAVASSMQDTVLAHLVSKQLPWVDVLFGDTGYHFAETIGTRDAAELSLDVNIVDVRPGQTVAEQDATHGPRLYERDPEKCCALRKVAPMRQALRSYEAWATGLRRGETSSRRNAPLITWDEKNQVVKVNPLAGWTDDQVDEYADAHGLVVNPLLGDGYPSIGCAPCTQRVEVGADKRSGRWAGRDKVECGLHG
ncbi:phosphoadenylyl-sulfate reductase [Myceligenerans xiligouense]|uniref:Adenosine 5'-phosphosulfate reductase n=1 Tax=Myceligenerans xiligouense TaxID=253184 RepID=A0A3N4ZBD6_9MICO|nr:phosphoadenylyl-sulfate reductase [Myceligenerans xiligouense]RPF22772.1 phosphoadenosine phosphosulfate reductase [Myceligenerans xiligouense]